MNQTKNDIIIQIEKEKTVPEYNKVCTKSFNRIKDRVNKL